MLILADVIKCVRGTLHRIVRCRLKHRSIIAFALGVLAGILFWPDGSDTPDEVQQSVKPSKVLASDGRRMPTGTKSSSYAPQPEFALPYRGQMPPHGKGFAGPDHGLNNWEWSGQGGYGPRSVPQWSWGTEFPNTSRTGAAHNYAPSYNNPMYPNIHGRTGYRFRPRNGDSDSDTGRRYTGNYQPSPHTFKGTSAPRWNERPVYGQPQPRRRDVPTYKNQQPNFQLHSGDLYSAQ